MTATQKFTKGLRIFATDIAQGFFEITHNGFALLGLAVMFAVITLTARPEIRQAGEVQLMSWLQDRQTAVYGMPVEPVAVERATATNPQRPAQTAGCSGLLAEPQVQRGARAHQRAGGRSL